jgi:flagellar biosynthesis protein
MTYSKETLALEYGQRKIPVLSARGSGAFAERILEEAKRRGIFIAQDPQLVALLGQIKVDEEIPQHLFAAVAVVLSWVYWLKDMRPGDEKNNPPSI